MNKNKAVFLDRDGVLNEIVYYDECGILDSPSTIDQLRIFPWVGDAIGILRSAGFKIIIVSNQPGIAKSHFLQETFDAITDTMRKEIAKQGASIDGEYYCFHHHDAKIDAMRVDCECRKPKPGLLLQAADDMNIALSESWMIGDGLTDVKAGKSAGCKTILLGRMKCELCFLMDEMDAKPDVITSNLLEAAHTILKQERPEY